MINQYKTKSRIFSTLKNLGCAVTLFLYFTGVYAHAEKLKNETSRSFLTSKFGSSNKLPKNAKGANEVEKLQLGFSFLFPIGVSAEIATSSLSTFYLSGGVAYNFVFQTYKNSNGVDNTTSYFILYPYLQVSHRWYYNLDKRADKGKNVKRNSGNYISAMANYTGPKISGSDFVYKIPYVGIGPVWGIQRTYGGNFNLGLELGLTANIYLEQTQYFLGAQVNRPLVSGYGNFRLGFVF